jgi:hypothetical protein
MKRPPQLSAYFIVSLPNYIYGRYTDCEASTTNTTLYTMGKFTYILANFFILVGWVLLLVATSTSTFLYWYWADGSLCTYHQ